MLSDGPEEGRDDTDEQSDHGEERVGEMTTPLVYMEQKSVPDTRQPRPGNFKAYVVVCSMGFFFVMMSYAACQGLATSLDPELGTVCLSALYATFCLFSVIAPKLVAILGPKWSMVVGGVPYVAMILVNIRPSYALSVPVNAACGAGAAMLWTGASVYVGRCCLFYADQTGLSKESATSQLNGLFYSLFQANGAVGLALSGIILGQIGDGSRNLLFVVLGALASVGLCIFLFVPAVPPYTEASAGSRGSNSASLVQTLKLAFSDARMFLLIPLLWYNGQSLGFMFGNYTGGATDKALGLVQVTYVTATFYGANMVFTYLNGKLAGSPAVGRAGVMVMATIGHTAFYILFIVITVPTNYEKKVTDSGESRETKLHDPEVLAYVLLYGGAVLFALADSVFESQLPAILQSYFNEKPDELDAAMGNLKIWQSLGFASAFALQRTITEFKVSLYILLSLLIVSSAAAFYLNRIKPLDTGK